jgi:hypothetical protein
MLVERKQSAGDASNKKKNRQQINKKRAEACRNAMRIEQKRIDNRSRNNKQTNWSTMLAYVKR